MPGLFSFVLLTQLPDRIIFIPQVNCVRIRVVIRLDQGFWGKDAVDCIIGSEQKLFARDGFLEIVFLHLHRYGKVVSFD